MSDQNNENPTINVIPAKTYVRGSFLFSTEDGTGYEQKTRHRVEDEVTIEDKANLGSLKRQIQSKKEEIVKKKQKAKKEKQMLIPIRDTPVEPVPEPMMDNNKCERATQEQFEYFQTYISLKQKQRKFEEEQERRIEMFEKQQERFRKNQENEERKGVSIVLEKDERNPLLGSKIAHKKKGPAIKVVIKKKDNAIQQQSANQISQKKKQNHPQGEENEAQQKKIETFTKVRVIEQKQQE